MEIPRDIKDLIHSFLPSKFNEKLYDEKIYKFIKKRYKSIIGLSNDEYEYRMITRDIHITIPIKYIIFDWATELDYERRMRHICNKIPTEICIETDEIILGRLDLYMTWKCSNCDIRKYRLIYTNYNDINYDGIITYKSAVRSYDGRLYYTGSEINLIIL